MSVGEATAPAFLAGGGEMGARVRAFGWDATPFGPPETWPAELKGAVDLCLHSSFPTAVYWGPELRLIYNDAWAPIPAERHPGALGRPGAEVWSEIWEVIGPQFARVKEIGEGFAAEDQRLDMIRDGVPTETYWTYAFTPIRSASGEVLGVLNQGAETTEHILTQRALAESDAKFRAITNSIDQMIWSTRPDGFHDFYNDRWYEYTGVTYGSTDGEGWNEMFHPDDQERAWALWRHSLETGDLYEIEYRLRHRSGRYRWVLGRAQPVRGPDGRITRWFGTCTDIQDSVEAREVLSRSREELERLVERRTGERDRIWSGSSDLMGTAGLDGFLKQVNPAWARMLGRSEAELLDRRFFDLIRHDDWSATDAVSNRLRAGETVKGFVNHLVGGDGAVHEIMWDAAPDGEVFHIVGRDIGDMRRLEEQLRQAQKMEAVGQLTGGIAHDFNNLLTGVTGSLELLQARVEQGRFEAVERYVSAAQGAARRAAALTQRLLAFSRRQTLDPRPVSLNRLVADMEELVRRSMGPAITTEVVGAAGLWAVLVDVNQVENALLNLCINARDAMPDGGRLTIETANKWLDDRAAGQRDLPAGQYVSLCVTDTGTGMTPEVATRAFDPFFTTKPMGEGTGLGLSMIYGFARQSGGQVRIYSEVGQGTTMCLYLPRHYGEAEAGERAPVASEPAASGGGGTVLVVDDEPTVRMLVSEVLEEKGYRVLEAHDGAAGLAMLRSDLRVDLLITDVGLPGGMNGRQLADAGRSLRPSLPVLFITGYAENAAVGDGRLDPGMQLLTKPFTMDALAGKALAILEHEGASSAVAGCPPPPAR